MKKPLRVLIGAAALILCLSLGFAMFSRKASVTVTFNGFEGDTAVLSFTNSTGSEVPCWWEGEKWLNGRPQFD